MPRVFRVMREENGMPACGAGAVLLGVRVPGDARTVDIVPDDQGVVQAGTGGMSVSPNLEELVLRLPAQMIPDRLGVLALRSDLPDLVRAALRDARGKDSLRVWSLGDGPFEAAPLTERLTLRPDPEDDGHGFVEPAICMHISELRLALENTRSLWIDGERIDE